MKKEPPFKDVLFAQVMGEYRPTDEKKWIVNKALGGMMPVVAGKSTVQTATFTLEGKFKLPTNAAEMEDKENLKLSSICVNLTWVRVYRKGQTLVFHVFPGRGTVTGAMIDQDPPAKLSGGFGYYQPIGEVECKNDFDYQDWIRKNLL